MPSRPPSPAGDTPDTLPSSVFLPVFSSTRVIVPSSREETSRPPSGRGARPHGVFRPSVTVRSTFAVPLAGGVGWVAGPVGDAPDAVPLDAVLPPASGGPPPSEVQPAVSRSAAVANTAVTARGCTFGIPSTARFPV